MIAVTATSATAVIEHPTGVCANDSGGPVFLHGVLVGIVTHRTGPSLSSFCSRNLVFTRLDSPEMRQRNRPRIRSSPAAVGVSVEHRPRRRRLIARMDALLHDLRLAFRGLVRAPLAVGLAVVCLALGIGTNATMFSVVSTRWS